MQPGHFVKAPLKSIWSKKLLQRTKIAMYTSTQINTAHKPGVCLTYGSGRGQKAIRRKTGWGLEPNRYQFRPRPSPVLLIFDFVSPLSTSKSPPNRVQGWTGD